MVDMEITVFFNVRVCVIRYHGHRMLDYIYQAISVASVHMVGNDDDALSKGLSK
jgi:hypothetical protein